MSDEIDELKKIIQEAWNKGDSLITEKDTFGRFLDRAADEIHSQGYRKESDKVKEIFEEIDCLLGEFSDSEDYELVSEHWQNKLYRTRQMLKTKYLEGK